MINTTATAMTPDGERAPRFNPNDHLMQIKSGGKDGLKDYLPVQWRLVWFRECCPQGTIETEMIHLDLDRETEEDYYGYDQETRRNVKMTRRASGFVIFRAVVKDGKGGIAIGTKSEKAASFADYIEKAETGAIGRALAALGFGTQFAPELGEEHRIVDAPVDRPATNTTPSTQSTSNRRLVAASTPPVTAAPDIDTNALVTEQQLTALRKLYGALGNTPPVGFESMSYADAKGLLKDLQAKVNERRQRQPAAS